MSCSGNSCSTASKGSCSTTSCSKGSCPTGACSCNNNVTFTPECVTFHGYNAPAPGKKHIGIIGCGSSGLIVMKQLLEMGHKVTCFESSPRIGGVYSKSYNNMMLTTSSLLTAFSDYSDGKEDKPVFWDDDQYLDYLDGFATKFNLYDHVQFTTLVQKAYKCPESGKWRLTVDKNAYTCPHRTIFQLPSRLDQEIRKESLEVLGPRVLEDFFAKAEKDGYENVKLDYVYDYFDHKTGERKTMRPPTGNQTYDEYAFDGIAICSGVHTWACLPCFKGEERFKGPIVHSENYKTPEIFRDKRVLIIGAGESGSDICKEVANEASKVAIAVRGKHGHIIPRKQAHGRVTDLNTNRCRYSNPYILGDWVGWANQHAKKFVAKWGTTTDETESQILQKIGELNLYQRTSAFSKFGCKNEGFVTAMVTKGAELHRDCFELYEDRAVFDDGSEFKCDAIVACTGYRNSFPFFESPDICGIVADKNTGLTHKCICEKAKNPRLLYKQIFIPEFPTGEVAFFGFVRPAFGSVPPTVEMQARYYSLIMSGQLSLPDTACMRAEALRDQCNWESRFGYDAKRVKGLVDFQLYVDDLAGKMGCLPPLRKIFFTNPKIWWKIMFGPFTMHQFRLVGPFANKERAELVYSKQPVGDFLECSITAAFLITAKILSILGFKQFTPNNF